MQKKSIAASGQPLGEATKVLIMLHGRGANAADILSLANHLNVTGYTLLAPEATNNSWYPYSFLVPIQQNEPWLSSAISMVSETVSAAHENGIRDENIFFLGFSQGACLTLEYVARNAKKYGGVIALTGGLIGDKIDPSRYQGNFLNTPVFLGTSNPDPHVPVERVHATAKMLTEMKANVTEKVYDQMGHTISQDEMTEADKILQS